MRWQGEQIISHKDQLTLTGPRTITIPCRKQESGAEGGGCRHRGYSTSVLEARLPIHIAGTGMDVMSPGGTNTTATYPIWGFAIAWIHWNALVENSGVLEKFAQRGYGFQLTRDGFSEFANESDRAIIVLAESLGFSEQSSGDRRSMRTQLDPIVVGESWSMTITYRPPAPWLVWVLPLLVITSFCISFLVFNILLQKREHINMKGEAMAQHSKVETERNMTAYFAHELRNRKSYSARS